MENNQLNSPLHKGQSKDKVKPAQIKTIFHYLQENVATASMVSDATGVPQKNITRYKRDLEKAGKLWEIMKTTCKKTGFKAWYLTTNPDILPKRLTQLNLFDDGKH
jgi:DNA-binding MarR family transcriptional regulator